MMEKMINMPSNELAAMGECSRVKAIEEFDEGFNHKAYLSILNM